MFIRASESINVTGVSTSLLERKRESSISVGAAKTSTGNGGSLTLETPLLNVADGGIIRSSSQGTGKAGDINITADFVRLNKGQISAQTASTDGGNINLNLSKYLLLRNNKCSFSTAGTAQAGGNGGNININSRFIVAIPKENSDITANAFKGSGGNINIASQGIFGLQFRPQPTAFSDITASSQFGVSGTVILNSPMISNLQNGLNQLPNALIDTNALFANSCIVRTPNRNNTFYVTGSSSLPLRPGDCHLFPTPLANCDLFRNLSAPLLDYQENAGKRAIRSPNPMGSTNCPTGN